MRVFLFRHGAVQHTGEKIFLGRTDLPLSAEGRLQAEAWKCHFMGRLRARIVSSPLSRALEFARTIAGDRAADVEICRALSEIDLGDWDGQPMNRIQSADPESWRARGKDFARYRPPGGESFADLQARAVPAFERLVEQAGPGLAVVSHAGVTRAILCHLLGVPLENLFRIGQDFACLNVLDVSADRTRINGVNLPCPT